MNDELVKIYTGSSIEASYLIELLKDNEIEFVLRDSLKESIIAGWASGSPENSATIYVNAENTDRAKEIIKTYFETRED